MDDAPQPPGPGPGSAFLLAQIGAHAAMRFAERIGELDLTPPQTGLLRAVAAAPGRSQQALATVLGTPPSRLVALVDQLDERGLVQRRRNPADRRLHALHVTEAGEKLLQRIAEVGRAHDDAMCAALDDAERATLRALLGRIADEQGLTPGVHPGYRHA
ncbi:MarR family transcriptional regulator [Pseudonocardia sulfidoxydans NBRC 16205]|uniref:MarR family transcriptional regulator n=1 Tax=Pseudonocardia sulfidoxydans NBRC 16205 TaxID=1223511 RepID=A0A511DA10_9PSEU|nr:MarR family transcriptional regulator [Pseudonocardia sulfidoxydans]GEL21611.1 MarR family transcriptional regulator [Pseudonocardia sulfidoxydans NBRC 16205]